MWPRPVAEYLRWRADTAGGGWRLPSLRLSVALAMIPPVAVGAAVFGWRAVAVVGIACAVSFASEAAARFIRPERSEGWEWGWLVTGLLVGSMLPPHSPLWLPAVCSAVAAGIGTVLFGHRGHCWLPPSALGLLAAHALLPGLLVSGDWPVLRPSGGRGGIAAEFLADVSDAVPRHEYMKAMREGIMPSEPAVSQPSPQKALRDADGGGTSPDVLQLLSGYTSGTTGGTSGLAWLMAAALLLLSGAAVRPTVAAGFVVFAAGMLATGAIGSGPSEAVRIAASHVLCSGFPAALLCWISDPSVAGASPRAKIASGAMFGLLAVAQRVILPPVEDLAFAAVAAAALVPLWDHLWTSQQTAVSQPLETKDAGAGE